MLQPVTPECQLENLECNRSEQTCTAFDSQGKLVGHAFEWTAQQPIDNCLDVLSACMLAGNKMPAIMGSSAELIGDHWDTGKDDTNLVDAVLGLMGLTQESVGEHDNLAALGIDSMQLMEVRTVVSGQAVP